MLTKDQPDYRLQSPLKRVRALGSAKSGTTHWKLERMTALALIPLTVWFLYGLLTTASAGTLEALREWLTSPISALLMVLTLGITFMHARLGVQVIVEDYVHRKGPKTLLLLLNTAAMWLLGLLSVMAVVKLHFFAGA